MFQHTAARRRLPWLLPPISTSLKVSTHSRPKAAACVPSVYAISVFLFQHTAARRRLHHVFVVPDRIVMFQHTAARRRLHPKGGAKSTKKLFQHTAARRRLPTASETVANDREFQHTAARRRLRLKALPYIMRVNGFNTQPPEGGCAASVWIAYRKYKVSTHSRPKAAAHIFL